MTNFFLQLLTNAAGLYIADFVVAGFFFTGASSAGLDKFITILIAAVILGIINFFLKPVLKLISAPLIIITLGLWMVVINIFLLWLLQFIIVDLVIANFWAYFWTTVLLTALNIFVSHHIKESSHKLNT